MKTIKTKLNKKKKKVKFRRHKVLIINKLMLKRMNGAQIASLYLFIANGRVNFWLSQISPKLDIVKITNLNNSRSYNFLLKTIILDPS
jgi:hypothetical protein